MIFINIYIHHNHYLHLLILNLFIIIIAKTLGNREEEENTRVVL